MSIRVVRALPQDKWRCFVDEHPQGNIFHTPEMFQVFSRTRGHQPTLWASVSDDGHVLALLLPVQLCLMDGLLRHLTMRAVVYGGGLYVSGAEGQQALDMLLRNYTQEVDRATLFTELRNLSDMDTAQPVLCKHGFVHEGHLNYLIDLKRPPEAILQSIGHRTRKRVRQAIRRGEVVIEEVTQPEQLSACYDLLRNTYRAARVPLADRSLFEAVLNVLHPLGMVRVTLARVGSIPIATSVELLYKDLIYGWYGGMDRAYDSYHANELLMWHILQWGSENGYRLYDFGGAGKPDEGYGVRDFKAKFGGKLVEFGRNTCVHSRLRLEVSQIGYYLYRQLAIPGLFDRLQILRAINSSE